MAQSVEQITSLPAFDSKCNSPLLKALSSLAEEVANCPKSEVCQRRNGVIVTRRVKQLSVFFDEIKDTGIVLPAPLTMCFGKLHQILYAVKLLLQDCTQSSCMWLLTEHERYSKCYQELNLEMGAVLDNLPLDFFDLAVDVQEQVDLVRKQARNSKLYIDPNEEQLRLDVFSVMEEFARKGAPNPGKLKWIFQTLQLNNASDCQKELLLLEEEMKSQTNTEMVSKIVGLVSFVRYCKCILYGVTDLEETMLFRTSSAGPSLTTVGVTCSISDWDEMERDSNSIPDDFKCPISLDLMTDPVIVATGQTYDRASITRWMDEGHSTCPTSGLKLIHNLLIPNYALRNLIRRWCEEHNIPFAMKNTTKKIKKDAIVDSMASMRGALEATKMTVAFLVEKMSRGSSEVKRQVAYELRMLAKSGMDNRMFIGEAGAIPHLVSLLSFEDSRTQENAITALLNLSIYEGNKVLIMEEAGALNKIIDVLMNGGCREARENAAATLFSVSGKDNYKVMIGNKSDALVGLVRLLNEGTPRGKRDAASALFNLCLHNGNKAKVVESGAVHVLLSCLESHSGCLPDDALAVLAVLGTSTEGLAAIAEQITCSISILASLVRNVVSSSSKTKENSIAILLSLCRYGGEEMISTVLSIPSVLSTLHDALDSVGGTPRGRRKIISLLRILHSSRSTAAPRQD